MLLSSLCFSLDATSTSANERGKREHIFTFPIVLVSGAYVALLVDDECRVSFDRPKEKFNWCAEYRLMAVKKKESQAEMSESRKKYEIGENWNKWCLNQLGLENRFRSNEIVFSLLFLLILSFLFVLCIFSSLFGSFAHFNRLISSSFDIFLFHSSVLLSIRASFLFNEKASWQRCRSLNVNDGSSRDLKINANTKDVFGVDATVAYVSAITRSFVGINVVWRDGLDSCHFQRIDRIYAAWIQSDFQMRQVSVHHWNVKLDFHCRARTK